MPPLHITCAAIGTLQSNEHSSFTSSGFAPGSEPLPFDVTESLQASLPPAVSRTLSIARFAYCSVADLFSSFMQYVFFAVSAATAAA